MIEKTTTNFISSLTDTILKAVEGDYSVRVSKDEFGPLADAINKMIEMISEQSLDLKQAEEALREGVNKLTNSQRLAQVGSWDWDIHKGEVEWTDEVYRIFGLDADTYQPQIDSIMKMFHPEARKLHEALLKQAIESHEIYSFESTILLPDGNIRYLISTSEGHFDESENLARISGTVQDVTALKLTEMELSQRERLLNNIIDQNPYPIWISDNKGSLIRINQACCHLLGIKEEEVVGKYNVFQDNLVIEQGFIPLVQSVFNEGKVSNFIIKYYRQNSEKLSLFDEGKVSSFILDCYRQNPEQVNLDQPTPITLDVTISPVKDEAGIVTNAVIMHRDITETLKAKEALQEARTYAENLIDSANAIIVVLDSAGQIQVFNEVAEQITGYTRQELLGRNWFEILVPKDRYPEVWDIFQKLPSHELPRTFENPILTKSGKERYISWRNTEIVECGLSNGLISYGVDITERKQLEEKLLQAQKMEAIGQLAGGIAHDFNNMLTVILGHSELLKSRLSEEDPLLGSVLEIEKAGVHSRDFTRQLLAFSRKQLVAPKTTNLNKLIKTTKKTLSQLIGENINLSFFPKPDLWNINFDPSQIDQILINLVVNARDAMPDGGKLTIQTTNVYLDESFCSLHVESSPGHYVLLIVSDNGVGIDKDTLLRIFEPFFTTKEQNKGTGLGLATVYGIVKQNGGFISVYSIPKEGTTFKIYIPRIIDGSNEENKGVTEKIKVPLHSGTILLVEDDELVREMTAQMLETIGYSVITAESPLEALAFCKNEETSLDLLITDVVMPQMNGTELNEKLKAIRPGLQVLFMSGYTENVIINHGVLEDGINFIQKPFAMNDFAKKIRKIIKTNKQTSN